MITRLLLLGFCFFSSIGIIFLLTIAWMQYVMGAPTEQYIWPITVTGLVTVVGAVRWAIDLFGEIIEHLSDEEESVP